MSPISSRGLSLFLLTLGSLHILSLVLSGCLSTDSIVHADADGSDEICTAQLDRARANDCSLTSASCLTDLNASSGSDYVDADQVMAHANQIMEVLGHAKGRESLHLGGVGASEWTQRFVSSYCASYDHIDFPQSTAALKALQQDLASRRLTNGLGMVLVHADNLTDGIGARFKKAVEIVAAGLRVGFDSVGLAISPASGYFAMPGIKDGKVDASVSPPWGTMPVWCHESPQLAGRNGEMYPWACWHFAFQSDILAQSLVPEVRTLLWGAAPGEATISKESTSTRYNCLSFRISKDSAESIPGSKSAVWDLIKRDGLPQNLRRRLFASVRSFANPALVIGSRREEQCGFGGADKYVHAAMHVRRGDVGDKSSYSVSQQMKPKRFGKWLCRLTQSLGPTLAGRRLMLHVYTESKGQSRASLRESSPAAFAFEPEDGDDLKPLYHTSGSLSAPACDTVESKVHFVINNNPRDAALCMARADVLIPSLSSLSWVAAVLHSGPVFFPGEDTKHGQKTHWDLRDQYLDWADNWFAVDAVSNDTAAVQKCFEQSQRGCR